MESSSEPRRRASVVGLRRSVVIFEEMRDEPRNMTWGLWRFQTSDGRGLPTDCRVVGTLPSSHEICGLSTDCRVVEPLQSCSRQCGTAGGDLENRNLATSVSLERKGSARDLHELHESSEWKIGISRHQHRATPSASHLAREGTVSSFWILGKVSEGCAWNNNNEAAGRVEPRDPRSPETLVVTSGTGECDRVPLGKASGAWSAVPFRKRL